MTLRTIDALSFGGAPAGGDMFVFNNDANDNGAAPTGGGGATVDALDPLADVSGDAGILDGGETGTESTPDIVSGEISDVSASLTARIRADVSQSLEQPAPVDESGMQTPSEDVSFATLSLQVVEPDAGAVDETGAMRTLQSEPTNEALVSEPFASEAGIALFALESPPVTLSFQQGVGGYTGTFDTFIRERSPDKTYGTLSYVDVDGVDSSGVDIQGLLSFSGIFGNGPGQIPLGAVITSASLTLSVSGSTRDPVALSTMLVDWTSAPNWTWNAYGGGIQTNGVEASAIPAVTLASLPTGTQTIDVTASVQGWANGAPNFGWLLTTGSDGLRFDSSESGSAPILNISYSMPTDPLPGLSVVETGGSTRVAEGGAGDSFSVVLDAAPTANVTITISTTGGSDLTLAPVSLTFTPENWQTAQTVSLSAIDDGEIEGSESFGVTLTAASADGDYDGRTENLTVTVTDNDAPPPPPVLNPAVVRITDTTLWKSGDPSGYGSGDPSGIAYIPGLDRLFIADSEHDESPYFSSVNLFSVKLDGTNVGPASLRSFTSEPTGFGYNPNNGLLYITDDDKRAIFVVDPVAPSQLIRTIDLRPLGITDAEDPIIDPDTGHIFFLDGVQRTLYEITDAGALVRKTVLPSAIVDAEAMAFDAAADVFYIAGGATRGSIFQTDMSGNILARIDLLNDYENPISTTKPRIKGLELAPSSDPNDGNKMSLYAVDYGLDQVPDGRMFEIDLYHDWQVA